VRLVAVLLLLATALASAQELPAGPGRDAVMTRCLACHEIDLIVQQRLSTPGWTREVDKMVRWGAVVEPGEREPMIGYLSRHFGVRPAASRPSPPDNVEATYKRACLGCHEGDIIEGQRLPRAGWTRTVEKMIRWGAAVDDSEKSSLVDYLAGRFPVR